MAIKWLSAPLRGLYKQLGLSRDPAPLPYNDAQDEKGR